MSRLYRQSWHIAKNTQYNAVVYRMTRVCHSWKKAVCDDKVSHERRLHYLACQAVNKVVHYC